MEDSQQNNNDQPQQPFFSAPSEHMSSDEHPETCAGTRIAQYVIERELGRGAMGVVYLAKDERLDRLVAIKSLPARMKDNPEALSNMQQEAKLLAQLNHPNIGLIHDILELDDSCYLILEYVPGQTLAELMANGKLTLSEIITLAIQIVEAMSEAHRVDIVHRDLKPANIKITEDGKVKVLDFGIGITSGQLSSQDNAGKFIRSRSAGTPAYMSPEQIRGDSIDQRADIWAFGCILYEMLTGRHPFAQETTQETFFSVLTKPPDWTALPEYTDPELKDVIEFCLQKDVEKRCSSTENLLKKLQSYHEIKAGSALNLKILWRHVKNPRIAIAILITLTMLSWIAFHITHRRNKIQWARTIAIPKIVKRIDEEQYSKAYDLAMEANQWIPDDQMLEDMWPKMSTSIFSLDTVPSNAKIFYREYSDVEGTWKYLGLSPFNETRFPYGCYRLRVQKEGFNDTERFLLNTYISLFYGNLSKSIVLHANNEIPSGMVYVPNKLKGATLWMMGGGKVQMGHYFIDKNEVTNKEYFEFVKDGGYQNPQFWEHQFIKDEKELLWDQAMAFLHDSTGQPGPKHWQKGKFPAGKDVFPVTGISWYEADAYANYRGKSLPTLYHWVTASMPLFTSSYTVPLSNFSKEGPKPVGSMHGMNLFGSYDMAGNVSEWCYNSEDDFGIRRYKLGGAWNEFEYMYYVPSTEDSFHRSEYTGFRCIKRLDIEKEEESWGYLSRSLTFGQRNVHVAKPVSDYEFRLLSQGPFSCDQEVPLNPVEIETEDVSSLFRKERITINAAYDGERMDVLLFIPKDRRFSPPYETVVIFPSASGLSNRSSEKISEWQFKPFLIKSGRAVALPIYKGMYERGPLPYKWNLSCSSLPVFKWAKDWTRAVDYLKTRKDIDADRLAFYGFSLGGVAGIYISGPEKQPFKACIFRAGGIPLFETPPPDRDTVNYLPRIKIPVLMINGRNDSLLPLDASQKPMYKLLGTPEEDKHHIVVDEGTHTVPQEKLEKEIIQFLDRYLGKPNIRIPDSFESEKTTVSSE